MSADPDYPSGSYFDWLQVQLELNVVSQYKGIMGYTAQNASQGVSPSISAVDTGIKATMALSGALTSGIESAYLPALEALGLSGMACLPISKQLDPVVGVHIPPASATVGIKGQPPGKELTGCMIQWSYIKGCNDLPPIESRAKVHNCSAPQTGSLPSFYRPHY